MTQQDDLTADRLTKPLIFLMSLAVGVIVANIYYLQPLLHQVKGDFAVGTVATSALITLVQVGYAAGLAFIVPLGDLLARRRLIVTIFVVAAAAMIAGSLVHSFVWFALLTIVVGLCSVGGQILIPFAADLAKEGQRGRVVARLMTGLLLGILLSRTFSGIGAEIFGWRGVYVTAAVLLIVMAAVLSRVLPNEAPRAHVTYRELVGGSFRLFGTYRELRRRCYFGAINFAAFNVLWASLAFQLSGPPFHYSNIEIGLFGLLGVGGVLAANLAGRQADRNGSHQVTVISALCFVAAFALMWLGRHNVWLLAVGIFVLDLGEQGMLITNQAIIYTLAPDKRSQLTSVYMVSFFVGGAVGSLAAGFTYAHHGWTGICVLGTIFGLLATGPALWWRPEVVSAS
jgi:predicted MFS family arabinose efflux permease